MTEGLVLAIDVGTSAIKAAVLDALGHIRSEGRAPQQFIDLAPGRREHDPRQTWRATKRAVTSALGRAPSGSTEALLAVGITGPRGTFCLTAPDGRPVSNFVTWQDQRAASIVGTLSAQFDATQYQSLTGMGFDSYSALPKLIWMREHDPQLVDTGAVVSTPQAYVLRQLGAEINAVDPSVAAHLGLLDLQTRRWSDDLREAFAVAPFVLPRIVDSGSVVGASSVKAKKELGIPEGVPLVLAASDGICAELGVGVTAPGQIYSYLGTASAIAGPIAARASGPADASRRGGTIRMPGRGPGYDRLLGLGGAGGSAVEWGVRLLRLRHVERFDTLAAGCAPGASGVLFVPTLAGAAAPEPEPTARGAIVGLSLASGPEHVARAIYEGVALELRWMLDEIRSWGVQPTAVHLTGGGARSHTWTQVIADVLQLPMLRSPQGESGLRGVASYAFAVTSGQPASFFAGQWAASQDVTEPSSPLGEIYERLAAHYQVLRQSFVRTGTDRALFDTAAWLSAGGGAEPRNPIRMHRGTSAG